MKEALRKPFVASVLLGVLAAGSPVQAQEKFRFDTDGDSVMDVIDAHPGYDDNLYDHDRDGIIDAYDLQYKLISSKIRLAWGDTDRDGVINAKDFWPGMNDALFDHDRDGTPDYLDPDYVSFKDLNNNKLIDTFEWTSVSSTVLRPSTTVASPRLEITQDELNNIIVLESMKRRIMGNLINRPDRDGDGISDKIDATPDVFTNDRDGDGDPDFYDPAPGDYYVNSRNDSLDPKNDEYWEKHQEQQADQKRLDQKRQEQRRQEQLQEVRRQEQQRLEQQRQERQRQDRAREAKRLEQQRQERNSYWNNDSY